MKMMKTITTHKSRARTFPQVEVELRSLVRDHLPEDVKPRAFKLLNELADLHADVVRVSK